MTGQPCAVCDNWADGVPEVRLLTGHNTSCPRCPDTVRVLEVAQLIRALVRGIEAWGDEEDGIYPPTWDAYVKAKALLGEPVKP